MLKASKQIKIVFIPNLFYMAKHRTIAANLSSSDYFNCDVNLYHLKFGYSFFEKKHQNPAMNTSSFAIIDMCSLLQALNPKCYEMNTPQVPSNQKDKIEVFFIRYPRDLYSGALSKIITAYIFVSNFTIHMRLSDCVSYPG